MATTVDQHAEYVISKVEAKRSSTLVQLAALVGIVICITGAALLQNPINEQRKELGLVMQSEIYKELPPKYAWISAAGGTFRGIAADFLWMRADQLKEEGKYYESHQLAKWICTLQPRFAAVWSFHAWNMSYNISVATHTAQERWQWVYNGIRLLRDEGIQHNEKVTALYRQLAWTWFHKVGDPIDDFHWSYKRVWASTMDTLLGSPPASLSNQEAVDWFRPIAEAPHRFDELIAQRPGVESIADKLYALGVDLEADTSPENLFHPIEIRFFRPYTKYLQHKQMAQLQQNPDIPEENREAFEIFADIEANDDPAEFDALIAFLRSQVLREQYKMDPQYMLDMSYELGVDDEPLPIDWRTPWSQGLYWAMYGTDKGSEINEPDEFNLMNTDRIELFALAYLWRQGRYIFRNNVDEPMNSFLNVMPDFRYIEPMHQKYLKLGKVHADEGEDVENKTADIFRPGHVNHLHAAIMNLYLAGRTDQAEKYFLYLARNYKDQLTGQTNQLYLTTFQEFIDREWKELAGSHKEALAALHSLFEFGYLALAGGQVSEFNERWDIAAQLYKDYQEDTTVEKKARRTLPPLEQIRAEALIRFIVNPTYSIIAKTLAWQKETLAVRRRAYDDLYRFLPDICEKAGVDMDKAFPEPEGMEEFRKNRPADSPDDINRRIQEQKRKELKPFD